MSSRRTWRIRLLAIGACAAAVAGIGGTTGTLPPAAQAGAAPAPQAAKCPWMNRAESPARRAHQLVRAMTLDQKIAELYGRGDMFYFGAANYIPAVPSLCIPDLVFNDAGAGVGDGQTNTTAFPDGIAQAASWSSAIGRRIGRAIGWEAWHKGIDVQLAPGIDVTRNPLNGRNFEYAGEDPYLSGRVGAAAIRGIQSQHVVATVKHYALNDQETNRMTDSSDADERTMQEMDLAPFEAAVRAGVGSVMCSYNRVNGTYACQNRYLLRHVLEKQFGFTGWVMSDWRGTHSTVKAANAGLDQEQDITPGHYFNGNLKKAVQQGKVSMRRLNDMVFRLMHSLFRIGVFDDPPAPEPAASRAVVDTAAERAVARRVAEAGTVLLKNRHRALPLHGTGKTIAVIGEPAGAAGAARAYQGGGSSQVPISGTNPNVVSPLQGITARAQADNDTVVFDNGNSAASAAALARTVDVAIVFAADSEAEGSDRPNLRLSCSAPGCAAPNKLISAVAAANAHTAVVLQTGAPVVMPWLSKVKAVLETWYPGQEDGNAAAAVLFGDVNPAAKLPYTFPRSFAQTPIRSKRQWPGVHRRGDKVGPHSVYSERLLVGYRWYDAKHLQPLFPFGFGLSYTHFRFSRLRVRPTARGARVRFTVTNTGGRAGAEVAQLYVGMPRAAGEPPKQLKAFRKVHLLARRSRVVTIRLGRRAFSHWNARVHGWRVTPGRYRIRVGDSSRHLPLRAALRR